MAPLVQTNIISGDVVAVGSPAQIPLLIGTTSVSSIATGTVLSFDPGDDPRATLGNGKTADAEQFLSRNTAQTIQVAIAAATWTPAPSLTHLDNTGGNSPTGPNVTIALGNGIPGNLDDHNLVLRITTGGALGSGIPTASLAYDGGAGVENFPLPSEGPAILRGTVDLTSSVPALNGLTLIFSSPSATTITFASSPTTAQGAADAFNALAISGSLAARARIAQVTTLGVTQMFFELFSTATGTSAGITVTAPSTADTTLGLSNTGVNGTAATYALPLSGHVLTFPTGTYVLAESYIGACVGPRISISAAAAALNAAVANFPNAPFGLVGVSQPADTAPNCASLVSTLETIRLSALQLPIPREFYIAVGGTWHTTSTTAATNQTNIASNDNAMLAAFAGTASNPNSVCLDDCYVPGSALLAPGKFRRSTVLDFMVKRAAAPRVAATVAEGLINEISLVAGDGLTFARDQNTATVHLEGLDGPGFFGLKSADDSGNVKFALGATRAGRTSRLRHDGDFAVCAETARLIQAVAKTWEAQRPALDPTTGQMADLDKLSRQGQVDGAIRSFLLPDSGLPNCTDFTVTIGDPPTGKFQDNGITPVTVVITTLGTITQVIITVAASGVNISPAPTTTG